MFLYKKQWVTSQPPIAHFNLNLNYEKFICLFTLQSSVFILIYANLWQKNMLLLVLNNVTLLNNSIFYTLKNCDL